ncbi:MAG TPA: ABC transporter permease subunit, partial [Ktedonobacterales bacterium]|nr:ABC transporter permease subunit [Ktedonobacterales bacterium]
MGNLAAASRRSAVVAVLLALLAALLVITSRDMFGAYQQAQQGTSVAICARTHSQGPICDALTGTFRGQFGGASFLLLTLTVLPALAGMFFGAPLVAREMERSTYRLAWTQGVTRQRWMLAKVATVMVGTLLLAATLSLLLMWWRGPLDQVAGDRFATGFDLEGGAPVAYALFAVALGIAAGALARRTVPAMAMAFVGFVMVRGVVEFALRPRYVPPVARISDPTQGNPTPYNGD